MSSALIAMLAEVRDIQRRNGMEPDIVAELNLVAARSGKPLSQVMRGLGIEPKEMK